MDLLKPILTACGLPCERIYTKHAHTHTHTQNTKFWLCGRNRRISTSAAARPWQPCGQTSWRAHCWLSPVAMSWPDKFALPKPNKEIKFTETSLTKLAVKNQASSDIFRLSRQKWCQSAGATLNHRIRIGIVCLQVTKIKKQWQHQDMMTYTTLWRNLS